MKATEYHLPGGVIDVEHIDIHHYDRARKLREQLGKARRRLEQALESRHRRLAVENYERFVERGER